MQLIELTIGFKNNVWLQEQCLYVKHRKNTSIQALMP